VLPNIKLPSMICFSSPDISERELVTTKWEKRSKLFSSCSSSIMSLTASSTDTDTSRSLSGAVPLDYPKDFFNPVTGSSPTNEAEAIKLWPYRKSRPQAGLVDVCPPDGGLKMLQECAAIRASLHTFVIGAFLRCAREEAEKWKVGLPSTNGKAVTERDLVIALGSLRLVEGLRNSEFKAYMIGHHFHRSRGWLAHVVDDWCLQSNIRIVLPAKDPSVSLWERKKRQHQTDRGGFGVVARIAKSQIQKRLMRGMLRLARWCISVQTRPSTDQKYERIKLQTDDYGAFQSCYLVTGEVCLSVVSLF
jgi:hypothetical protein